MDKQTQPDYMELTKETSLEESDVHIYELDVPKIPGKIETKSKEAKENEQSTPWEYDYVRHSEALVTQKHTSTKKVTSSSLGGGGAVQSKVNKGVLVSKPKDKPIAARIPRKFSFKSTLITALFILTLMNTALAAVALAIGGILYVRLDNMTGQGNNSTPEENFIDI